MNKNIVEEIYNRNCGTQMYYRRSYCEHLIYTEGIKDFQETLNAYWFIDCIITNLPKVIYTAQTVDDGFFIVKIRVNAKNNSGMLEIYREGYINGIYEEHISVFKQKIHGIDLPVYNYKFYLIWTNVNPVVFTLLLPGEY